MSQMSYKTLNQNGLIKTVILRSESKGNNVTMKIDKVAYVCKLYISV